jgi:hypothetical protein
MGRSISTRWAMGIGGVCLAALLVGGGLQLKSQSRLPSSAALRIHQQIARALVLPAMPIPKAQLALGQTPSATQVAGWVRQEQHLAASVFAPNTAPYANLLAGYRRLLATMADGRNLSTRVTRLTFQSLDVSGQTAVTTFTAALRDRRVVKVPRTGKWVYLSLGPEVVQGSARLELTGGRWLITSWNVEIVSGGP